MNESSLTVEFIIVQNISIVWKNSENMQKNMLR